LNPTQYLYVARRRATLMYIMVTQRLGEGRHHPHVPWPAAWRASSRKGRRWIYGQQKTRRTNAHAGFRYFISRCATI
jgi:hypothetical protein